MPLLLLLLVVALPLSAADDPIEALIFADGAARTLADFPKQTLVIVTCIDTSQTSEWLRTEGKAIQDAIEARHAEARLILVTPDRSLVELAASAKRLGLDHALLASDVRNARKVGLPDGKGDWIVQVVEPGKHEQYHPGHGHFLDIRRGAQEEAIAALAAATRPREFAEPTGVDPRALELWWRVERHDATAVQQLQRAAKSSPVQADARTILATVTSTVDASVAAAVDGEPSIAALERLEDIVASCKGLDLAAAEARIKALVAAPELAKEIAARAAWRKCRALLDSTKPTDRAAAKAGFTAVAAKFPETRYGQQAARIVAQ